jgi:hypothetical protein
MSQYDQFGNQNPYAFKADVERVRRELLEAVNQNAGGLRRVLGDKLVETNKRLSDLAAIADVLRVERSNGGMSIADAVTPPKLADKDSWKIGHGVVRIEDIPGRRIPYVLSMDLYIGAGTTSDVEQSVTISQEGPFVAVRRMATFRSAYSYSYTDPQTQAVSRFSGRSNGRFRPIHSAWDLNDAANNAVVTTPNPLVANTLAGAPGITSSMAGFRSMELDALISVIIQGASYPRQNYPVPSTFWSTAINAPVDLGALDFFERGEQVTVRVTPTHPNNPSYGNANGLNIFGTTGWPFLAGQFDPQEGIMTPGGIVSVNGATVETLGSDPIVRLPDGILTVAYEGYKIIQPTGPVG